MSATGSPSWPGGRLTKSGPVKDLLTQRDILKVEVTREDDNTESKLRDAISNKNLTIRSLMHPSETLEELFLKTVDEDTKSSQQEALNNQSSAQKRLLIKQQPDTIKKMSSRAECCKLKA